MNLKFFCLRKLLCEMILSRLATLNILPILAILPALLLTGKKKNTIPKTTRKVSRLFHLSAKKFSGPIATILMASSTTNTQMKILSNVSTS